MSFATRVEYRLEVGPGSSAMNPGEGTGLVRC